MLSGLKIYAVMILVLIGAQMVVAGENVVDFQRALKTFEKEREPSQEEAEDTKSKFENPALEIQVKETQDSPKIQGKN